MRISQINIEGKDYPLCFSLSVATMITEKYKDVNKLKQMISDENVSFAKKVKVLCDVLASMIDAGCRYYNVFHKRAYPNAPINKKGKFIPLTSEQIECSIDLSEETIKNLACAIRNCIEGSQEKKLGIKPGKNAKKK